MCRFIMILILAIPGMLAQGQDVDESRYQDTVFLRYNRSDQGLQYGTDTLVFKTDFWRNVLIGTTVMPWTSGQIGAIEYGVRFDSVAKSTCEVDEQLGFSPRFDDHIQSVEFKGDVLIVTMSVWSNCCHDFLCDVSVEKGGTLNLMHTGYGRNCSCGGCCFGLTYRLTVETGKDIPVLKAVMINGNRKTLKPLKRAAPAH
jgi:hypothetical protein